MNNFKKFFKELDPRNQQIHLMAIGKKLYVWTVAITHGMDKVKQDDRIFIDDPLTLDEVDVFLEYIDQQAALQPMIDPTAYMRKNQKRLELARTQIEGFRALLRKLKEKP